MAGSTTTAPTYRTGGAAVAAGALLFLGVAPELLWPVQRPDGSITNMPVFLLYGACWIAGAAALLVAVHGLQVSTRAGRIGRDLCRAGAGLLVAFGLAGMVSALLGGAPAEWSFLLFALGMLLFLPGGVALALGLRRAGAPAEISLPPLGAAGGVLVALAASADPWHDLGLLTFCAMWIVLGVALLRGAGRSAARAAVG